MLNASYEFENGYAKPINRGVVLWNGSEDDIGPDNPRRLFDDLIYEALGEDNAWLAGYHLKGIKVTIEIAEATRQ